MADAPDAADTSEVQENETADSKEQPEVAAGTPEVQNQDGGVDVPVAPDADFSEPEPEVETEAETMVKQEMEEMEQMTQAVTAAVEEHMAAEAILDEQQEEHLPAFFTTDPRQPVHEHRRYGNVAGNRFPCLTPNKAHIARLPSPRGNRGQHLTTSKVQMLTRSLNPTKMNFISKVSMSAR